MHINIYTDNHSEKIAVDDTIQIFSEILRTRKINFSISNGLNPDSKNYRF